MTLYLSWIFALLTIVAMVGVVGLLASRRIRRAAAPHLVGAAAAVTGTATLGSLYLSEIAGYAPCELCWVQRIFMYPLAVVLTVALIRRRDDVWTYAAPLAAIGLPVSAWHVLIQRLPAAAGGSCDPLNPCSSITIERLGFITIPVMAGTAFLFVLAAAWAAWAQRPTTDDADETTPDDEELLA